MNGLLQQLIGGTVIPGLTKCRQYFVPLICFDQQKCGVQLEWGKSGFFNLLKCALFSIASCKIFDHIIYYHVGEAKHIDPNLIMISNPNFLWELSSASPNPWVPLIIYLLGIISLFFWSWFMERINPVEFIRISRKHITRVRGISFPSP